MITIEKVRATVEELIAAGWIAADTEEEIEAVTNAMFSIMTNM